MSQIILDVGSGRSLPDYDSARALVHAIKAIDTGKHEVILKAQLFKEVPPNIPLDRGVFEELYDEGKRQGYKVTASAFDLDSLKYLLDFDIPFVKIACRPSLRYLIGEVPRRILVYASVCDDEDWPEGSDFVLTCVPEYPAKLEEYPDGEEWYSDHVAGLSLWEREKDMEIWEKHIVLTRSPDNPDSGPFAVTPDELRGIL